MSWDANWIAIDFGTTNTAVAVYQDATAEIVPNSAGRRLTPSVVSVTDTRTYLVGSAAVDRAIKQPKASVRSIKRHLGEDGYALDLTGGEYQPEQVAAMILQKAKRDAENYLGEVIDNAVLTVPAYFSDRQRQALKDGGDLAGFDGVRLISDPAATAMAYGLDDESDQTVLVYDLGGGTFSLGIIELGGGVYEVVATNGNNDLGGDDWDRALVDHLADEFEAEHGVDLREDPQARQRLVQAATEAKHELSTRKRTTVSLPFIAETGDGPVDLEQKVTRAKFESLTSDLLERTVWPTKQALEDAGYDESDIDEVLLVGGSTRMPQVREQVEELTGQEPRKSVNPDEAVALGASVHAGVFTGAIDDVVLLDVTPLSLGVEVKGGLFERLLEKNTTIPTMESKIFTTAADNQTTVNVRVFQGEREIADENELLGEFQLTGIPPAPAGTPRIEVSFSIDENGIVNVEAEDKGSGNTEEISIQGGPGYSETELDRLRRELDELTLDRDHDAGGSTEGDQRQRERLEARDDAEAAIQRAETLLEEEAEVVDADLRGTIEGRMDDVASLLEAEDATVEEYEAATEALSEELQEIGKQIYQQQAKAGDTDDADVGGAPAGSAHSVEPGTAHIPAPETVASPPRRNLSYQDLTIETELGSGGQAVVQKARLVDGPPEYVALRQPVMPDTVTREAVDRFLTKADAWATIDAREREKHRWENYEHIVGVVDVDDQPWVATEYMDAGDLGARLEANPDGIPVAEALWLGECLCKGVEIAHSIGIAHLDLKPENVLLRETDRWAWPKIADWGLARMLANNTGAMEGLSVEYAAPEQFDAQEFGEPDQLTDIYQIGKLVYALLTGDSPTTGSQYEVMQATMSDERITPPSTRQAAVPPAVDAAIGLALERDKRARYDSVSAFKNALHAIRTGERLPRAVADRLD